MARHHHSFLKTRSCRSAKGYVGNGHDCKVGLEEHSDPGAQGLSLACTYTCLSVGLSFEFSFAIFLIMVTSIYSLTCSQNPRS